jgi:hypothetical protein
MITWSQSKGEIMKSVLTFAIALTCVPVLIGCAALQVAVSKRNLDVQNKMSSTIFLDPSESEPDRTIYLQIRNTSDKKDFDLRPNIETSLKSKGYKIVDKSNEAKYVVYANVLQVGKTSPNAAEAAMYKGYGMDGVAIGGGAAYLAGGSDKAIVGAGIVGGLTSVIADSAVKDVYYSVIVDVQIKERADSKTKLEWKTHQTRVLSTANKMNLELAEALPVLKDGISSSVAGIF